MSRIIQCLSLCDWLISVSIISLKFLHVVACDRIFLFLSMHALPYIYISHFLSHSSVGGHLGCFNLLTIVNNPAMKMGVQISPEDPALSSLGHTSRNSIARYMVILFLTF